MRSRVWRAAPESPTGCPCSFFTALGQDFLTVSPGSVGAKVTVGVHLILSAGWMVVLFAAVMTSIGPKLERIARRQGVE